VEAAGAHAAAAGRPDVVADGAVSAVVQIEAAEARSLLGGPGSRGDRGGHLRAHGRAAAEAPQEAAARRAAAARCKAPDSPYCPCLFSLTIY
jgi:hypothetical protein